MDFFVVLEEVLEDFEGIFEAVFFLPAAAADFALLMLLLGAILVLLA